jgi:hypothetical protein
MMVYPLDVAAHVSEAAPAGQGRCLCQYAGRGEGGWRRMPEGFIGQSLPRREDARFLTGQGRSWRT